MTIGKSQFLFWTCVGLWLGLLIAGLWPFNFYPRNQVHWFETADGLHFERYGQAYSNASWFLNDRQRNGDPSFTIELWLRPGQAHYPHFSNILSLYAGSHNSDFSLAQSGPDLVIAASFLSRNGDGAPRHLWMDDACHYEQPLFVSVASGAEGTLLYWDDGSPHTKIYPDFLPQRYFGRLVLGHAPSGNQPWTGDVFGLAIYDRALSVNEIRTDHKTWIRRNRRRLGARAVYAFDEHSGVIVHNSAGTAPDLVIPAHFKPLQPTVLEFPYPLKRTDISDTVVNIVGFVPFGFSLCAYFREKRRILRTALIWTLVFGCGTSLGIELLQELLPSRDSSLLDLINNAVGTGLGALLEVKSHELWRRIMLPIAAERNGSH